MTELLADFPSPDPPKTCLDVIRDALTEKPLITRLLLVLTMDKSNPRFDVLETELKGRAEKENAKERISGIGMFVANFAVLFIEGAAEGVMKCVEYLEGIRKSEEKIIKDATLLFFSDYRSYKLMPTFWSHRPKDYLEVQLDEGENELNEENVLEQAFALYEKMIMLAHKLQETNMEAQLDPTGLLSREFIRYCPDPRSLHSLLSANKTKELLFSLQEFYRTFIGDFYATVSQDVYL